MHTKTIKHQDKTYELVPMFTYDSTFDRVIAGGGVGTLSNSVGGNRRLDDDDEDEISARSMPVA